VRHRCEACMCMYDYNTLCQVCLKDGIVLRSRLRKSCLYPYNKHAYQSASITVLVMLSLSMYITTGPSFNVVPLQEIS
jgi:hypothetical protein